jgi:hypothetical protein
MGMTGIALENDAEKRDPPGLLKKKGKGKGKKWIDLKKENRN